MIDGRNAKAIEAAGFLVNSKRRLAVFEAVYYHKQRAKSVADIVARSGLSRMQVLQAGGELRKAGLVGQGRKDNETAYLQVEEFQAIKNQIINLARNPDRLKKIRQAPIQVSSPTNEISFVKSVPVRSKRRTTQIAKQAHKPKVRIGFLSTNPDPTDPLRTDKEVREIKAEVRGAKHFSDAQFEHIPAADVRSLLNHLNDFEPDVLQFSGHGGDRALYFDDGSHRLAGGQSVDFDLINEVLRSLNHPPRLLVFSACDSLEGAEQFLGTTQAVVGMASSIGDSSAIIFSARFYAALLSGQNLESSLQQGKLLLKVLGRKDADYPTIITAAGLTAKDISFF